MTLQINTTTGQRALTTEEQAEVREGIGAQSSAQTSAAAVAAVATHAAAADPHPGKYAAPDHTHTGLMTTAQTTKLDGLPTPTALDAAIAGKADASHTHTGLMTAGQSTKLDALPTAATLADAQAAQDLAISGKAAADHTHTLLMTEAERTKLADLPTAAALTTAQAAQDAAISGRMLNSADAIADALDIAPPADLARIQSSVSGDNKILLKPSGDVTFAADSLAVNVAASSLFAIGGGVIEFAPGIWYVKDHELRAGVAYVCESLPNLATDEVCADLGLSDTAPFPGGAVFKGTGTETVFAANTTPRVSTSALPDPADKPVTGVRIERLVGWNIATLVRCGATDHNGLAFSTLRDLYGFAIKGRFLDLRNIQHVNGGNLKAIDAKHTLYICNDHSACQTGNSHFSDIYGYSWAEPSGPYVGKGTDWQIKLECIDTGRNFGGNLLNYVTLNGRVQTNNFRDTTLDRTRGNAQIVLQGASLSKSVNLCEIDGTDMEGHTTYGLKAQYATGCRVKTNGASAFADTVATIHVKNSLNFVLDSNTYDTTVWLDAATSCYASGYIRYFAYDNNEAAALPLSQRAKGLYTLFAKYSGGTTNPTYATQGGGNGATMLQLGTSESYAISMAENENVLRFAFIPIAAQLTPMSINKTWGRWEASTVLLLDNNTTQTLPLINSTMDGVSFTFKSTDTTLHTIQGQSGQTIDGAATYALTAKSAVTVTAVAATGKWFITAKF